MRSPAIPTFFDREIENFFQATLPVRCAGLGQRNSYKHSSAAYVASVLSCLDLMLMLIGPENVDVGRVGVITLADLLAGTNQKTLSHKIDQTRLKQLQDSFEDSPRDTDCIAALTTPRSREFLNLVPCRDLHIRSDQFWLVRRVRLK